MGVRVCCSVVGAIGSKMNVGMWHLYEGISMEELLINHYNNVLIKETNGRHAH